MSGLLILKSDRICVSVPAVGRALLPNRPTVRQENKGKFGRGGRGGGRSINLIICFRRPMISGVLLIATESGDRLPNVGQQSAYRRMIV